MEFELYILPLIYKTCQLLRFIGDLEEARSLRLNVLVVCKSI